MGSVPNRESRVGKKGKIYKKACGTLFEVECLSRAMRKAVLVGTVAVLGTNIRQCCLSSSS